MSEKQPRFPENFETKETGHEEQLKAYEYSVELRHNKNEHETRHEVETNKEQARNIVEKESSNEAADLHKEKYRSQEKEPHQQYTTKKIKDQSYKKTMSIVQKDLTPSQRFMSRIIHNPVVEKTSDVAAKTIVRPSGIIGGGMIAILGALIVMIVARKIGFEVPNSLFAVLFIIGFFIGIAGELILKLFRHQPKS